MINTFVKYVSDYYGCMILAVVVVVVVVRDSLINTNAVITVFQY